MCTRPSNWTRDSSESNAEVLYTMGNHSPKCLACNMDNTTCGTTCSAVIKLMLCVIPILQFHIPLRQLFRREIEAFTLVRNVVLLAEHTAKVAARVEDGAGAIVSLNVRFLTEVRRYHIHFDRFSTDEAYTCRFVSVDSAKSGAKIAVSKVSIGQGAFPGCIDGREEEVPRRLGFIEEERGCQMETSRRGWALGSGWKCVWFAQPCILGPHRHQESGIPCLLCRSQEAVRVRLVDVGHGIIGEE